MYINIYNKLTDITNLLASNTIVYKHVTLHLGIASSINALCLVPDWIAQTQLNDIIIIHSTDLPWLVKMSEVHEIHNMKQNCFAEIYQNLISELNFIIKETDLIRFNDIVA